MAGGDAGPGCFRNIDHYHDGDLSPRELLRSAAAAAAAYADHDGLLDAQEAAASSQGR